MTIGQMTRSGAGMDDDPYDEAAPFPHTGPAPRTGAERTQRTQRTQVVVTDRSTNLWPPALPSFGESQHNSHHPDPTCTRHGRRPGQFDLSAGLIRLFERLGWTTNVHWPTPQRPHASLPTITDRARIDPRLNPCCRPRRRPHTP
jgi:hypothetical protein